MIKKLTIPTLILAVFALVVFATGNLTDIPDDTLTISDLSVPASKVFTIENKGLTDLVINSFNIQNYNVPKYTIPNSKFSFNKTPSFVLPAGNSQDVELTVSLSGTNAYQAIYAGTINITSNETGSFIPYQLSIAVTADHSNLTAADIITTIAEGYSRDVTLTLTNIGNTDVSVTNIASTNLVSTTNPSNKITGVSFNPTALSIPYKSAGSSTVTIAVPLATAHETYVGNITTTYGADTVVSQLTVNVQGESPSINVENINFGTVNRNSTVSKEFTVTNNGNIRLTNIAISASAGSQYNVLLNQTALFNLDIGGSRTILASATIPYNSDAGTLSIGSINIQSVQLNKTSAATITAEVESKLIIYDLDIIVGGVSQDIDQDGEKIDEDAKPGSKVVVELKVENTFDNDIDIEDIQATITIADIDNGEDLEDEITFDDLEAGERSDTERVEFEVPLDVEKDTYDIIIDIEGTDTNDVKHAVKWTLRLDVAKEKHELIITGAYLSPSYVKCSRYATLNVEIKNIGTNDEDETKLEIKSSDLELDFAESDIEISSNPDDNEYSKSLRINVPEGLKAGTYPITVRVYYKDVISSDFETINLEVQDCVSTEKKDESVVVVQPPEEPSKPQTPSTITGQVPVTTEKPFTESAGYIAVLALGVVITLGVVVTLFIKIVLMAPPKVV